MASKRSTRPEPCNFENCGSRRYHFGDDGYTYCERGHQQSERGAIVVEDTGELIIHGTTSRRKDSDVESTASRVSTYSGSRALEQYLLCIQLILRKQLRWLIEIQKLPEELEGLVKDLWALRLQTLPTRVTYASDGESAADPSQGLTSQSETEAATTSQSQSSRPNVTKTDRAPREGTPTLVETLCLCYVGCLLLRLPMTLADIHKWINDGELLYYRVAKEVPLGMRTRLPGAYQGLLDIQELLQPQLLHQRVMRTVAMLKSEFGMTIPPLNIALVLYRWLRLLALPLEAFVATQRLMRVLEVDGNFSDRGRIAVLRYPEVRLMAVMVIATKLLFPFDDIERDVEEDANSTALSMDWQQWTSVIKDDTDQNPAEQPLTFKEAFEFDEASCMEASEDTLDAYLDWYGDSIASEDIRDRGQAGRDADLRRALFRLFPTKPERAAPARQPTVMSQDEPEKKIREAQSALRPTQDPEGRQDAQDIARPGSYYRRIRSSEELSGPMQVFFDRAAKLAGVRVDDMVQAVFTMERRLQKREEELRKDTSKQ